MGLVQMLTSVYLVGWIFAIYWGYIIIKKSKGDHNEIKQMFTAASGQPAGNASAGTNDRGSRKPNNPFDDGDIAPAR